LVEALVGGRVVWGREDRRPVVRVRVVKGVGRGKREGERGKVGKNEAIATFRLHVSENEA
jgi:hypothetical protein